MPEKVIPLHDHLDWSRHELEAAKDDVLELLESDAWKALERSIEDRLAFEQRILMRTPPHGEEHRYERTMGQWAGLRQVRGIAAGIIVAGERAARELRDPNAAEAA